MRINNIDCCKPRRNSNFKGNQMPQGQHRYKYYEEMDNDTLCLVSTLKAHKEVEESGKAKLYRALPAITTALLGASVIMTQPDKLSAKAAAGLGFLALSETVDDISNVVSNTVEKEYKNQPKTVENERKKAAAKTIGLFGSMAAIAACSSLFAKSGKMLSKKIAKPVVDTVSKEVKTLAKEIDASKAGKFVNETINPFIKKHPAASFITSLAAPVAIGISSLGARKKLEEGMSKDLRQKANENFVDGKIAQEIARAQYDSIDAIEVKPSND